MLSKEDNELICRVGPGTAMGALLRQYWHPVLMSTEIRQPDSRPMRVRILGENLIAFRDSSGRVGLLANNCSHRGASLFFGRNEENGLRCVYHGWKYDVAGQCIDMPNEPPESGSGMPDPYKPGTDESGSVGARHASPSFKDKIRQLAYPCEERGGIVWAYLGPRKEPPPLPDLEWLHLPDDHAYPGRILRECNWMQVLEGDIDNAHVSFLHGRIDPRDSVNQMMAADRAPRLEVVDTDYGVMYGARRTADEHNYFWRIIQFLMPTFTIFTTGDRDVIPVHIWTPADDEHTHVWRIDYSPVGPLSQENREHAMDIGRPVEEPWGDDGGFLPNTTDWLGAKRPVANRSNDYLLDYEAQRTARFSGVPTIPVQDGAMMEGMGRIVDRTAEHLGTTDAAIIHVRRRLLKEAEELRDRGLVPSGVDTPQLYAKRSALALLPKQANWVEASKDMVKAFSGPPAVVK